MELLLGNTEDALKFGNVYTKQQRIAELAKLMPALLHLPITLILSGCRRRTGGPARTGRQEWTK